MSLPSAEQSNDISESMPVLIPERDPLLHPGRIVLHSLLFVITFFTTTIAGVQWLNRNPFDLSNFPLGLPYSLSLLAILTAHEFGHYFAARYHGVKTTLPFFIPVPPFLFNPFGTMGAVIRIRSQMSTRKILFDVGIAGPLAGLAVTLLVLIYGVATLPGKEFLYSIHPDYAITRTIPTGGLAFGDSIFSWLFFQAVSSFTFFPPMNEIYHYPFLNAAWFGLFVTALNLIPVGQLDGGHILYSLLGKKQGVFARIFLVILVGIGLSGLLPLFTDGGETSATSWLIWAAILFFFVRPDHPPVHVEEPLDERRRYLGWFVFAVFLFTFIPIPFSGLSPQ
ncbi:MAG: site-2 protease family protein [Ignavibacteriales bacterium]|nr:site-2 protease family protein [Ignavibacteriales bacterium]